MTIAPIGTQLIELDMTTPMARPRFWPNQAPRASSPAAFNSPMLKPNIAWMSGLLNRNHFVAVPPVTPGIHCHSHTSVTAMNNEANRHGHA